MAWMRGIAGVVVTDDNFELGGMNNFVTHGHRPGSSASCRVQALADSDRAAGLSHNFPVQLVGRRQPQLGSEYGIAIR